MNTDIFVAGLQGSGLDHPRPALTTVIDDDFCAFRTPLWHPGRSRPPRECHSPTTVGPKPCGTIAAALPVRGWDRLTTVVVDSLRGVAPRRGASEPREPRWSVWRITVGHRQPYRELMDELGLDWITSRSARGRLASPRRAHRPGPQPAAGHPARWKDATTTLPVVQLSSPEFSRRSPSSGSGDQDASTAKFPW
jgi:hypothetical protein